MGKGHEVIETKRGEYMLGRNWEERIIVIFTVYQVLWSRWGHTEQAEPASAFMELTLSQRGMQTRLKA